MAVQVSYINFFGAGFSSYHSFSSVLQLAPLRYLMRMIGQPLGGCWLLLFAGERWCAGNPNRTGYLQAAAQGNKNGTTLCGIRIAAHFPLVESVFRGTLVAR